MGDELVPTGLLPASGQEAPGTSAAQSAAAAEITKRLVRLRTQPTERSVIILPNPDDEARVTCQQNRINNIWNESRAQVNSNNRDTSNHGGNFRGSYNNRGGTRHNNRQSGRQHRGSRPYVQPGNPCATGWQPSTLVADWSQFRSVALTFRRVPKEATTWDIYNCLSALGNIVYIAIEEDRRGERTPEQAIVRFEPVPCKPILVGTSIKLRVGHREVWMTVAKSDPRRNDNSIRSPLGQNVPSRMTLKPSKLSFGIYLEPKVVTNMRTVPSLDLPDDLSMTIDFERKKLIIDFAIIHTDPYFSDVEYEPCHYRIETRFSETLDKVYRVSNDNHKAVVLSLSSPARFFRKKNDIQRTHASGKLTWGESELWSRIVDIQLGTDEAYSVPVSLAYNHSEIDLGHWKTYWFELDVTAQTEWAMCESALRDWNIRTEHDDTIQLIPRVEPQLWSWLGDTAADTDDMALLASEPHISLPFDVRYQLEVCMSQGIFEERNISRQFLVKLASLVDTKIMSSNRARLVLEYAADQSIKIWDPMLLFEDKAAMTYYPTTANIPHYCALVRKVTVTPTMIYFHSPTVETTNRVVRHYKQEEDFFLRVQFTDETTEGRINGSSDQTRDNELYLRAFRLMNNGIRMGQWHWHFLAFGNSQIRENGAFFFCEPIGAPADIVTCDKIRAWMGRFSHIKVAAKYAARLGQCFSTTRLVRGIPAPTIVNIDDVEHKGHCFTDGVGKMSPLLAQMVAEDWQLDTVPSAVQFRMGGCKGVLVTWPEAKGIEVHIRKSQEKFHSEFNGLEIIRFSNFSVATLNRQTILIMSCLGVPDHVFVDLLEQQLQNYDRAMTERAFAVQLLEQYVDENQVTVGIAHMLLDGFMETQEPFVMAMMQLWKSWSIKGLKEKARIVVDDGAFVVGCVDEARTLKGHVEKKRRRGAKSVDELPEIFLQISDPKDRGSLRVITGVCLVGRNPSLHPGDIRVVNAVDVPALRHLSDVLVFPMQGDQDLPSMCSGGDLDGDDYFVIWNQEMIPTEWFHPPMDYTPPPPHELDRDPNVTDLKIFFSLYMKNNCLPTIAHAHLAQADFMDSGAKDPRCVELAKLHSKAVDYVKTGVPAIVEKNLLPQSYPHFMEKKGKKIHRSHKVLGQLYDKVHHVNFQPNYEMPFDDRILKRYQLDNGLLKKVRGIKSQYDTALRRVMGQMEIRTEFEVLSTFVMSKPRIGTQYKLHEVVRRESEAMKAQFKEVCIKECGGSRDYKQLAPFVAAMYQITAEEVRIALHEARTPHTFKNGTQALRQIDPESMPLISFPWLFDGILGRIAKDSPAQQRPDKQADLRGTGLSNADTLARNFGGLDPETLGNMEYARTSDGRVIHRGQILRLFHHEDDHASDGAEDPTIGSKETQDPMVVSDTEQELPATPTVANGSLLELDDAESNAVYLPALFSPMTSGTEMERKPSAIFSASDDTVKVASPNTIIAPSDTTPSRGNTSRSKELEAMIQGTIASMQAPATRPALSNETNDLITFGGSPCKVETIAADEMKLKELTQRLESAGLELTAANLLSLRQSTVSSPTFCNSANDVGGTEESILELAKDPDTDTDAEVEEVIIMPMNKSTALEHLAKLS